MASRVNVVFVVILSAALALVAGGIAAAFLIVQKSAADHAQAGDLSAASGDWTTAAGHYSKAVSEDKANPEYLRQWIDALEHITPATNSDYLNRFQTQYRPALARLAINLRTNVQAHRQYLELTELVTGDGSRGAAETMSREVASALQWFERATGVDPAWPTLRRYRGLAFARLAGALGNLPRDEAELATADLQAAVSINPADGESILGLITLRTPARQEAQTRGRVDEIARIDAELRALVDAGLKADPAEPWTVLSDLTLRYDAQFREDAALQTSREARAAFGQRFVTDLDALLAAMTARLGSLDDRIMSRFLVMEAIIDPASAQSRYIAMRRARLEAMPDSAPDLYQLGRVLAQSNDLAEASALMAQVEALPRLPMGREGVLRLLIQQSAPGDRAEYELRKILVSNTPPQGEERAAIIAQATQARDNFAVQVGREDPRMKLIEAMLADAQAKQEEAATLYAAYNNQSTTPNPMALSLEAQLNLKLNRAGLAQQRLERLIEIRPESVPARILLSRVQEVLGNVEQAYSTVLEASRLDPANPELAARAEELAVLVGRGTVADPITNAILDARRLNVGTSGGRPDPVAAAALLRAAIDELGLDPRLARELAFVLMNSGEWDEARTVTRRAIEAHPSNTDLRRIEGLLEAGSITEAILTVLESSDLSPFEKARQRFLVLQAAGDSARAGEALDQAAALNPDDAQVIDGLFVRALLAGELEKAQALAERARTLNADGLGGRTFSARLQAVRGERELSISTMRDLVEEAPVNPGLWRMLGDQLLAAGRYPEAVDAMRRSVSITPADIRAVLGLVRGLVLSGNPTEALSEARRLRSSSSRSPEFLELYVALESQHGGEEGRRVAIEYRESAASVQPENIDNRVRLTRLYTEGSQWDDADRMITALQGQADPLLVTVLRAEWYAEQGTVQTISGPEQGIELARRAFVDYIVGTGLDERAVPGYLELARFMFDRARFDVALSALNDAAELEPGAPMRPVKLRGEFYMRLGRPGNAADDFSRVIAAGADEPGETIRLRLLDALMQSGRYEEARAQLDALSTDLASGLGPRLQRIALEMNTGNLERALSLADDAVSDFRNEARPWAVRAQVLNQTKGREADAIEDISRAVELAPNDWAVLRLRATMRYRAGQIQEALTDLRRAIELNPGQTDLLVTTLGQLIAVDRQDEAERTALQVLDRSPDDATLAAVLGQVFAERGRWDVAQRIAQRPWQRTRSLAAGLSYMESLLNSDPPRLEPAAGLIDELERLPDGADDVRVTIASASLELKRGRRDLAQSDAARAFDASRNNPGARALWLSSFNAMIGDDPARSIAFVDQMLAAPGRTQADADWLRFVRASLLASDQTNISEAVDQLLDLARSATDSTVRVLAARRSGLIPYSARDFARAIEVWRTALEYAPNDWQINNNIAAAIQIQGDDAAAALPFARAAYEASPGSFETQDTLISVLLASGLVQEAESLLPQAAQSARGARNRIVFQLKQAEIAQRSGRCSDAQAVLIQVKTEVNGLSGDNTDILNKIKELEALLGSGC